MRRVDFNTVLPVREETIDVTNKCRRRVIDCAVFYDDQDIGEDELHAVVWAMIGQEITCTFPDSEVPHTYYTDDVVFVAPHRRQSRIMLYAVGESKLANVASIPCKLLGGWVRLK